MTLLSISSATLADGATAVAIGTIVLVILLCIYRLTLHPYAKYPGPFLAKLTTLYGTYHAFCGTIHIDVKRCHDKYGKFVRYGPNALLVSSPTGYNDIYGPMKKIKKAQSYSVHGQGNLIGMQEKKAYGKKKKIFQQGFSDVAVRKHEEKVVEEIGIFCAKMIENDGPHSKSGSWSAAKNMSLWCNYLTTDVICKVVFTTSWNLLTSTANRTGVPKTMATVVQLLGIMHQTPILYYQRVIGVMLVPHLAWCTSSLVKYTKLVIKSSFDARKKNPDVDDVFALYVDAKDPETGLSLSKPDIVINSANLLIAGSDTTSSSLAATFFYLARDPDAYAKVAHEIRTTFASADEIRQGPALNSCLYLRAATNEAMRMCPVAPQPLWRETESGGCEIDGEHIPGGMNVGASIYTLHRNEEAFPDPYSYNIERWINHGKDEAEQEIEAQRIKEMTKSFVPFSTGPRQCLAKNFALMELTLTMANVFWRMDFRKPDGPAGRIGEGGKGKGFGRERVGELQFKGYFTSHIDGPMIEFRKRE